MYRLALLESTLIISMSEGLLSEVMALIVISKDGDLLEENDEALTAGLIVCWVKWEW